MTNFSFGQISFFNFYSSNGVDKGEGIVQLEDSSYVVTGSSSSFSNSSQAFLMKIDSLGNFMWSNHYGGSESESGRRVLYKKDYGFYICGFTNSIGNGGFDYYLAKTDEAGVFEWEKSYGDYGWEKVHDAVMMLDSGVMMVGETSSNPTDNKDIFIVRTDNQGDTLWTKTFGDSGDDFATTIIELDDSTYVIGGQYYNEDSLYTKSWACKLHEDGTVYWANTYGNNQNSWVSGMAYEPVNGIVRAVGGANGPDYSGDNDFNCVINIAGDYYGEYINPTGGDSEYTGICSFVNGENYYSTSKKIESWTFEGGYDVIIEKYSPIFAWLDNTVVGHLENDVSNQIIRTNDNAAVVVGYSTDFISGGNEIYVDKIGPNGVFPDVTSFGNNSIVTLFEEEVQTNIKVFPNPSSGIVYIQSEDNEANKFRIINSLGQVLMSQDFYKSTSVDLSTYMNGYYIIEFEGGETVSRRRVLVQQ